MRKGFTLIELLFVLVIIGVIGTLGYQKYEEVTNKSKAETFLRDVTFVKEALTEGYKLSNGVYQSCDSAPTKPEDPADVTLEDETCSTDQTQWAMEVERAAREALEKKGFKFKQPSGSGDGGVSGEEMRLLSLPLSKAWFPPAVNGVRVIRFEGIPGPVALEAVKSANGALPGDNDGYVRSKPFVVAKWDAAKKGSLSSSGGGSSSGSSESGSVDTAKAGLDAIVAPDDRLKDAEKIKRSAKVDLYYVMTYPQGW